MGRLPRPGHALGARAVPAGALIELHVETAGDPAAPPVLLLHGWPQHSYEWREVAARLVPDFRVLMPDNRGFGRSPAPGHGYDPQTFARDAVGLLDRLGIERVVLGGHDWGGFAAILLALEHPSRVERLVAAGAPHPWPRLSARGASELWKAWYTVALASPLGPELVRRGLVERYMLRNPLFGPEAVEAYARPLTEPARAQASAELYRAYQRLTYSILRHRIYDHLHLTMPARLLFGTSDEFVPLAYVDGPQGPAHGLEVELVAGAGHWIPEELPDLMAARLRGV